MEMFRAGEPHLVSHPIEEAEEGKGELDQPGAAAFDTAIQLISRVKSEKGKIQTTAFLDVFRQSLLLMGKVVRGPGFALLKFDVGRNIDRIAALAATDPVAYEPDMFKMIMDDVASSGSSAVSAVSLLWLKRSMEWFVAGLEILAQDPRVTVAQAAMQAYNATIIKWHTWILMQVFKAALHFVRSRQAFLRSLGVAEGGEEAAMQQVAGYCRALGALLAEVQSFLAANGLDNPAKVSQRGD